MIVKLYIKNYLILKEIEIDFTEGLNILTGETGAGKSIIIDALSLILGERADYSLIKKGQSKLVVEGYFNLKINSNIKRLLEEILSEEVNENIILRRELLDKGISRNFINDIPVSISNMKKFGDIIIDIHSQNEHQLLLNKETHVEILDNYINKPDVFSDYKREFNKLEELVNSYKELYSKKEEISEKRSFLDFQLKEINNLNLILDEDVELENELNKLENIEDISIALDTSLKILSEEEINILNLISIALKEVKKASKYDNNLEKIIADINSSYILLKESSESLSSYQDKLNFDNNRLEQIRDRLNNINHLKKKYKLTLKELITKAEVLEKELISAENFDYEIELLLKDVKERKELIFNKAEQLLNLRVKNAKVLEKNINLLFKEIGLESAEFKVEIKNLYGNESEIFTFKKMKLSQYGFNEIEFLIKTNKGTDFLSLKKSASGGEISRIMLTIKAVLSEKDNIPILVFDEIDAGISGRVAQKVGKLLKNLSKSHQIICITHLPQIAAMSNTHFHVSKKERNKENVAEIKLLSNEEKILEVAKLISGEEVTDASTNSALELINN